MSFFFIFFSYFGRYFSSLIFFPVIFTFSLSGYFTKHFPLTKCKEKLSSENIKDRVFWLLTFYSNDTKYSTWTSLYYVIASPLSLSLTFALPPSLISFPSSHPLQHPSPVCFDSLAFNTGQTPSQESRSHTAQGLGSGHRSGVISDYVATRLLTVSVSFEWRRLLMVTGRHGWWWWG